MWVSSSLRSVACSFFCHCGPQSAASEGWRYPPWHGKLLPKSNPNPNHSSEVCNLQPALYPLFSDLHQIHQQICMWSLRTLWQKPSSTPSLPPVSTTAVVSCSGSPTGIQHVQNSTARVFTFTRLDQLHWLPIKTHIHNQILCKSWPANQLALPPRTLLTNSTCLPNCRSCVPLAWASFPPPTPGCKRLETEPSVSQPPLWNSLPSPILSASSLDTFKKLLRHHLLKQGLQPQLSPSALDEFILLCHPPNHPTYLAFSSWILIFVF